MIKIITSTSSCHIWRRLYGTRQLSHALIFSRNIEVIFATLSRGSCRNYSKCGLALVEVITLFSFYNPLFRPQLRTDMISLLSNYTRHSAVLFPSILLRMFNILALKVIVSNCVVPSSYCCQISRIGSM